MTLEELQEQLLALKDQLEAEKIKNGTLSDDNEIQKTEIEELRTLNQKYFNKLMVQEEHPGKNDEEEEPEIPSCEEFAKELMKKGF